MKKKLMISGLLALALGGCSSMNNAEKGMLGGAAVGTGAGALIGRGNPAAMLVGGVLGTAVGGIAGSDQDRREHHRNVATAVANERVRNQMSLNDVVQLSQQGTHDQLIINQMDATGSYFPLTTGDLTYLRDQNVSNQVISAMQARRTPRTVIVQPYGPYGPPPVIVEPGVSVGIRGRF